MSARDDGRLRNRRQLDRLQGLQRLERLGWRLDRRRHDDARRDRRHGGDERAARDLSASLAADAPADGWRACIGRATSRPAPSVSATAAVDSGSVDRRRSSQSSTASRTLPPRLVSRRAHHDPRRSRHDNRGSCDDGCRQTGPCDFGCAAARPRGPGRRIRVDVHQVADGVVDRRRRFAVHSYAYPTDASFFFSSRRASETRHLTVPTGMSSIEPICSYE